MLLVAVVAMGAEYTENDWQVAFNAKVTHGKLEVEIATGRIDVLTDTHAIEVDHARNYRSGIKQALQYAAETKKTPGLALFLDGAQDTAQAVDAARKLCQQAGVTFWLINEYVSVSELATLKSKGGSLPPPVTPKQSQGVQPASQVEQAYWINTKSGIRHNRNCKWFGNTVNGRPCGATDGRPCKQCGG